MKFNDPTGRFDEIVTRRFFMACYRAFGMVVDSEVNITHLPKIVAQPAAVTIRVAPIKRPDEICASYKNYYWGASQHFVICVHEVGTFSIQEGRTIIIDPAPGVSAATLSTYLMGSAIGALLHQRGYLVIHGNAIVVNNQAVIFAGDSGVGKSTLAAHCWQQGYQLLGDDVCAIYLDDDQQPWVLPAYPSVKLWENTCQQIEMRSEGLQPVVNRMDKYHTPIGLAFYDAPLPLAKLFALQKASSFSYRELHGIERFEAISANTYRKEMLDIMGMSLGHLGLSAGMAKCLPITSVQYPHEIENIRKLIKLMTVNESMGVEYDTVD